MNNKETNRGGVGVLGLLGIAFIILKLCEIIEWSWLWVLAPFWIPLAIVGIVLLICTLVSKL